MVPAGYSSTPLVRKLGIKAGDRLALIGAPKAWIVPDLPPGVVVSRRRDTSAADVVVAFFPELATLQGDVPGLAARIAPDGALWTAWPRRAGGHRSDITDNEIRAASLPLGLVDVKVAALDEDWSGIKLVWRKELRSRFR